MASRLWLIAVALLSLAAVWWMASVPREDLADNKPTEPQLPAAEAPAKVTAPASAQPVHEPSPAASAPAQAQPTQPEREQQLLVPRQGPVAELERKFEAESRPSAARELEATIETTFRRPPLDPQLLHAVTCRQSICKLELRWSKERMDDYMIAITQLLPSFEDAVGVSPAADQPEDGQFDVTVYLQRRI
jgi:hypothetical protein